MEASSRAVRSVRRSVRRYPNIFLFFSLRCVLARGGYTRGERVGGRNSRNFPCVSEAIRGGGCCGSHFRLDMCVYIVYSRSSMGEPH